MFRYCVNVLFFFLLLTCYLTACQYRNDKQIKGMLNPGFIPIIKADDIEMQNISQIHNLQLLKLFTDQLRNEHLYSSEQIFLVDKEVQSRGIITLDDAATLRNNQIYIGMPAVLAWVSWNNVGPERVELKQGRRSLCEIWLYRTFTTRNKKYQSEVHVSNKKVIGTRLYYFKNGRWRKEVDGKMC